MGEQESIWPAEPTAPNKLTTLEQLRRGHGLLSARQFAVALRDDEMEVWSVGPDCYVLVTWGVSAHGKTLNILTALGGMEHANLCMQNIERLARKYNGAAIMSVGRAGWTQVALDNGYDVDPCILMKKVLND